MDMRMARRDMSSGSTKRMELCNVIFIYHVL